MQRAGSQSREPASTSSEEEIGPGRGALGPAGIQVSAWIERRRGGRADRSVRKALGPEARRQLLQLPVGVGRGRGFLSIKRGRTGQNLGQGVFRRRRHGWRLDWRGWRGNYTGFLAGTNE